MEKKITKGNQSNYEIKISFTDKEKIEVKETVLKTFQKDMNVPGFRKGSVPLAMVESKVEPEYINMSIIEHLMNKGIQEIIKENNKLQFIGEPYDFSQDDKDGTTTISFKLDIYPEVEIKNEKWENEKISPINVKAEAKEVEDSLINLKKNYADYKDADTLTLNTISKIGLEYLNKKDEILEKGTTYIGEQEFSETPFWEKTFKGKKKAETFEEIYKEKDLPEVLHAHKAPETPAKVRYTIQDIKEIILPEFTPENINKFFGNEAKIKNEEDLRIFITGEIEKQKADHELVQAIEKYINSIRGTSMEVAIPQTMVTEEFKVRLKSLEERFGGKEKVDEYLKNLGDKAPAFVEDIQNAAKESLEKFFILNKITEKLGIDIDWSKGGQDLEIEKKIYEKLTGSKTEGEKKSPKKEEKESKPAPKKTVKK